MEKEEWSFDSQRDELKWSGKCMNSEGYAIDILERILTSNDINKLFHTSNGKMLQLYDAIISNFTVKRLEEQTKKQMQNIDVASEDLEAMKKKEKEHKADHDERHHVLLEADNRVSLFSPFFYLHLLVETVYTKNYFVIPTDQGFIEDNL